MVVDKIISNVVKVTIGAAYTALVGSAAYALIDSTKRSNEAHKLAIKREKIGLPGYETVEEHIRNNK